MSYRSAYSNTKNWNAIDTNIRLVRNGKFTRNGNKFIGFLKRNNVHTIIRYYASSRRSKTVTKEEVRVYSDEGFYFLPVYQDRARQTSDFGLSNGRRAASHALDFVDYVGQPDGTTIFFAVDTDFSESKVKKYVVPYFEGLHEKLGDRFRIGAYGGGSTMKVLMSKKLITLPWLSESRGFSGTEKYFNSKKWVLRQIPPDQMHSGISYDKNEMVISPEEIGAFKFGDKPVALKETKDTKIPKKTGYKSGNVEEATEVREPTGFAEETFKDLLQE